MSFRKIFIKNYNILENYYYIIDIEIIAKCLFI